MRFQLSSLRFYDDGPRGLLVLTFIFDVGASDDLLPRQQLNHHTIVLAPALSISHAVQSRHDSVTSDEWLLSAPPESLEEAELLLSQG